MIDRNEGNPRKNDIDDKWGPIKSDLASGNARAVSDALENLFETDRGIWNAIYWRIDDWFAAQMSAAYHVSENESQMFFDRISIGRDRLQRVLRGIDKKSEATHWGCANIQSIMWAIKAAKSNTNQEGIK